MSPTLRSRQPLLIFLALACHFGVAAQCVNWNASASLISASSCAGNGAFTVSVQGPDAVNLRNIQYGIPLMPNGYSIPLSASSSFVNIPAGTYPVSVIADCGNGTVGRNASIVVPGNYAAPTWNTAAFATRASFPCKPTGWIALAVRNGIPPYTYTLTSYPATYTGPRTLTSRFQYDYFYNLPAGPYTIRVSDSCNSGTIPTTVNVSSLSPAPAPVSGGLLRIVSCDSIAVVQPTLNPSGAFWQYYPYDTFVKVSYEIPGVIPPTTPVIMSIRQDTLALPPGVTVKDLYGKDIRFTLHLPCGQTQTLIRPIVAPSLNINNVYQRCDSLGILFFGNTGGVCFPMTYSLVNNSTSVSYGPYVATRSSGTLSSPHLPLGSYTLSLTSGDGYTTSATFNVLPPQTPTYSVTVLNGSAGLNNFANGFFFSRTPASAGGSAIVELVSGPPGYTYRSPGATSFPLNVYLNQSPTPSTLKFPVGSYIWKITDQCGVHYLTVTVTSAHMYQFTAGTPVVQETCQGINVFPVGTATNGGGSQPVSFAVFRNSSLYAPPGSGSWLFGSGVPIPLSEPGTYQFVTTTSNLGISPGFYNPGGFSLGLPNVYTSSSMYVYNRYPLGVDLNQTQGFICAGAAAGSARIVVRGKDGFPFRAGGSHYKFELAVSGSGLAGPYLAANTTGNFSGFGGNANGLFDVKVTDSCGAFAVQQIRILDLGNARLASSSKYVACIGDSIRLNGAYLPGSTYTWTGPGGFSSTLRQPLIPAARAADAGMYYVTISTTVCNQAIRDSVRIVVNPSPLKPLMGYTCLPRPIRLSITNPQQGIGYRWDIGQTSPGAPDNFIHGPLVASDSLHIKVVNRMGSYTVIATDSIYGCSTRSDSLVFQSAPFDTLRASIYSPAASICQGDSAILVAKWTGSHPRPAIQWLRNGTPLSGATSQLLHVSQPGQYRVVVDGGLCNLDTSAIQVMNVVPIPPDTLLASRTRICVGDTAVLRASSQPGYNYVWMLGGTVIAGENDSSLRVTNAGSYTVRIASGTCVQLSKPVVITQLPGISAGISRRGIIKVCSFEGDTLQDLIATNDPSWRYAWYRNGVALPGDTSYYYLPRQPGSYHVKISSADCGSRSSDTATLVLIPRAVDLGPDTLICEAAVFPIRLAADTGYTSYRWSTGDTTRRILVPSTGYYAVAVANMCGVFRDTIRVRNGDDFLLKFPDDTLICTSTQRLILRLPAGLSAIRWNDGSDEAQRYITEPGRYAVTAIGPCGPVGDSVLVEFCRPRIAGTEGLGPVCQGDCIWPRARFEGYPNRFEWMFPGGSPSGSTLADPGRICYDSAGEYPVTLIVSGRGGSDTAHMMLTVTARPQLRFRDTAVQAGYKVPLRLPACATGSRADWYEDDVLICRDCPELELVPAFHHSVYRCIVRNAGCPDSCSYTLRVVDIPDNVWLPNAFTPNGDGRNDLFGIITDNPNVQVGNLSVYNRWGERVFLSNANDRGWDGTFRGRPADAGTYFWQLTYRILGRSESFQQKGDLLLLR